MKTNLVTRHLQLFNRQPTPAQLELYEAAPQKRGYSDTQVLTADKEAELFEAVLVLALSFTFQSISSNVYLFVPGRTEKWATQQLGEVARKMFDVCKQQTRINREAGIQKAKLLGECFHRLMVGSKISSDTVPPDHWVAFGFESSADKNTVPEWLMTALVPLYPFQRDD